MGKMSREHHKFFENRVEICYNLIKNGGKHNGTRD